MDWTTIAIIVFILLGIGSALLKFNLFFLPLAGWMVYKAFEFESWTARCIIFFLAIPVAGGINPTPLIVGGFFTYIMCSFFLRFVLGI